MHYFFPEDDEVTPEEAAEELSNMSNAMDDMARRTDYLHRRSREKQLDPKDAKLVDLAEKAGHASGTNTALQERIKLLERRIAVRDKELDRVSDYDEIVTLLAAANLKLARRRKR